MTRLSTGDHDRAAAGMTYVYPVVSRRSQGVSIGVNLNPNNACNWRCIYCQVSGLQRGAAPPIDLALLEQELAALLGAIVRGDWLERYAPEGARRLADVAFSGNGEPTSSTQLEAAVQVAQRVLEELGLLDRIPMVLITNGSLIHRPEVGRALERLALHRGEVWFKLDSATRAGRKRLNDVDLADARVVQNLERCAALCPTRLSTMALALDGAGPSEAEQAAWIALVQGVLARGSVLRDVLLYGFARASYQPEAPRLSALSREWLETYAARIRRETGLAVTVHE